MNNKNDQEITPEQLTALQKIFNNPDMTKEQAGHKVQAVRLHKQVLNEVRLKAVDSVNLIKMINDDNKPLKPNFQINIINVAIKIGLVTMLILNFNNSASMSFGYYHFLSLYGTVCFLIACFIEY